MPISQKRKWIVTLAALCAIALSCATVPAQKETAQKLNEEELLRARETVWRAWFASDTKTLKELVPPETIVMSGGEEPWKHQADVLRSSAEFRSRGGKLIRLEFPRTEVQHFGDVAIVWSSYLLETEINGKRTSGSSRATEIFVWQHGHWANPGWHTDEEK
jgi:ketosteroid isomerase-like protein